MTSSTETPLSLNKELVFILYVRVHIPVSKHAEFFSYFNPVFDKCLAEPECRFFFVQKQHASWPDYDPDVLCWVEGWSKDVDWLENVQMKKEYYEPYRTETAKMYTKPRVYEAWTPEEGLCQLKLPTEL